MPASKSLTIDTIVVEAFRGIDHLELDLRAPITLLYAANGTGKTTFCEAVEWLMTSQVDRLQSEIDKIRPRFGSRHDPVVRAWGRRGNDPLYLQREMEGAQIGPDPASAKYAELGVFLEKLAPGAADLGHPNTVINYRRHWLRTTHFLSIQTLSALIDTDQSTVERRKQLFADVLGIRHLVDAERDLRRYGAVIRPALEAVSGELERANLKIFDLELDDTTDESEHSSEAELTAAEKLLDPEKSSSDDDSDSRLQRAANLLSGRRQRVERWRNAMDSLDDLPWQDHSDNVARIGALNVLIEGLSADRQRLSLDLKAAYSTEARADAAVAAQRQISRKIRETQDRLSAAIQTILAAARRYIEMFDPPEEPDTLDSLKSEAPEHAWTDAAREARDTAIRRALQVLPAQQSLRENAVRLRESLGQLNVALAKVGSPVDLMAELATASRHADETKRAFDSALVPLDRLRSAGLEFLDHHHDDEQTQCPLCGHDWESFDDLRLAVGTMTEIVPDLIRYHEARLKEANERLEKVRAAQAEAARINTQVIQTQVELSAHDSRTGQFGKLLEDLGVNENEGIERELRILSARTALGSALCRLQTTIDSQAALVWIADWQIRPIETLPEMMALAFSVQLDSDRSKVESLAAEASGAEGARIAIEAAVEAKNEEIAAAEQERTSRADTKRAIDDAWKSLSGERPLNAENVDKARAAIEQHEKNLESAEEHLENARTVREFELQRARLKQARDERDGIEKRRTALEKCLSLAEATAEQFQQHYHDRSLQQLEDLKQVVNPLFGRMHANRIVDEIRLGEETDFLQWLADAGDRELDPATEFSQGQRQDLALSIFLARAQGLRGTYFLDEPVTHLDDLNRIGLLDVFRASAIQGCGDLRMLITTSNRQFARHMIEKFSAIEWMTGPDGNKVPPLRVTELRGNPRSGLTQEVVYPRLPTSGQGSTHNG